MRNCPLSGFIHNDEQSMGNCFLGPEALIWAALQSTFPQIKDAVGIS